MALINSANGLLLSSKTPVSSLQEILLRSNITPEYELVYNGVGTHDPIFKYKLTAGSRTVIGSGKSKKEAKHDAASTFLSRMKYFNALTENGTTQPQDNIEIYSTSPYSGALKENVVGMLNDLCILNNLPMPEYIPLKEEGPPHARMFTFQCHLSSIVETAVSRTKKQAKHMVSQQMINRLSEILGDKLVPVPDKSTDIDDDDLGPTVPLVPLENTRKSRYNWGLKLSLYHYKLADDSINFPLRIGVEEELKDKSLEWVDEQTDHENILDRLLEELDYTKEVIHLGPKCLLYNLYDLKLDDIPDAWLDDDDEEEEEVKDSDSNNIEENTGINRLSENLEEKLTIQDDHSENGVDEPVVTLLLRINGVLPFVFYGSGTSEKEAIHKATIQALKFYCLMSKSKSHVHS